jgi:hypothetical protein
MKYKLTKNTKEVFGRTLYQIEALESFADIEKGDLGGWVEKESNLSQEGNAWVFSNAEVYGYARVCGNAEVYGKLKIEAGCFFGMRYNQEEIKYKENEGQELIYKGEAKFGANEDEEVEKAIKLLETKGRLKDGKILS